ncbi:hypothetical protein N7486_003298 [Penicillium sp. IBT 16267x]|nr:hypothetical protein N7486_003298 [Penicillium sp. IBT 16267x]
MERQILSDPLFAAEDNGLFLWQIPLPVPASKKPSKLDRHLAVAVGFGKLRWGRRAQPDIEEVRQGNADSSVSTGIQSPISGDATGPSLVRAVWKYWKGNLGMKTEEDEIWGGARGSGWRRVMSLHRELQERRLVANILARISNYETREFPTSLAFPFHHFAAGGV